MKPKDLWAVHNGPPSYNVEDIYILEEDAKEAAQYLETTQGQKLLIDTLSNVLRWIKIENYEEGKKNKKIYDNALVPQAPIEFKCNDQLFGIVDKMECNSRRYMAPIYTMAGFPPEQLERSGTYGSVEFSSVEKLNIPLKSDFRIWGYKLTEVEWFSDEGMNLPINPIDITPHNRVWFYSKHLFVP